MRDQGAAKKSCRGSCQKGVREAKRIVEKRKAREEPGVQQRGRREAVVCQKISSCTHRFEEDVRAEKGRKNHRAEEGSALLG